MARTGGRLPALQPRRFEVLDLVTRGRMSDMLKHIENRLEMMAA